MLGATCNDNRIMVKEKFPSERISEFSVARSQTIPGLFFYRHLQAMDLLSPSDLGEGDLSPEERRQVLERLMALKRPLTAIVIFLNVVALEDLIRHFAKSLGQVQGIENYIPTIAELCIFKLPEYRNGNASFSPIHFDLVNSLYEKHLGLRPIQDAEIPKLKDLSQIRHIVAHNGSLIRTEDVDKFKFYDVTPNEIINPPIAFVRETNLYLYRIGRDFENSIKDNIFQRVISGLESNWNNNPPKIIIDLIEWFNYFGYLLEDDTMFSNGNDDDARNRSKEALIQKCIKDLV